jgi:hypothetical protein
MFQKSTACKESWEAGESAGQLGTTEKGKLGKFRICSRTLGFLQQ